MVHTQESSEELDREYLGDIIRAATATQLFYAELLRQDKTFYKKAIRNISNHNSAHRRGTLKKTAGMSEGSIPHIWRSRCLRLQPQVREAPCT